MASTETFDNKMTALNKLNALTMIEMKMTMRT